MKVAAILFLLALVVTVTGCGEAEEAAADTSSEVVAETADAEELIAVEEVPADRQFPDPWPENLLMPEGMEVVMNAANQDGYPLLETQFAEGVEPMTILELYNYYGQEPLITGWTTPQIEQNDGDLTPTSFHLDLFHPDYSYVILDGSTDAETGIITVELVWFN